MRSGRYGRTTNPNQQAAVMLYVHSLMGDARPGEIDPAAVNPSRRRRSSSGSRARRERHHGPYRVELRVPGRSRRARLRA